MATASDVLSVAASQIGVTEYPPNSNRVIYNTDYYGTAVSGSAYPWCVVFVWWVFNRAGAGKSFLDGGKTAVCSGVMYYAKNTRRWVTGDYRPGDVVIYDFNGNNSPDHCGIVESVDGTSVTAIEGNTSATGSQSNGGAVCRKTRSIGWVMGAFRPAYSASEQSNNSGEDDRNVVLTAIKRGSSGSECRAMQLLLIGNGYSCGSASTARLSQADGDCGAYTDRAIRRYQSDHSLVVDGICGVKTWRSLLGAS